MTRKKNKLEKWSDKHLIIEIDSFTEKQKKELKYKIMQKVAQSLERKSK